MTSLLKLDKVSKVYGEGNTEVTALHPMSLDVKAGEFIGIVGPSGSGKSTLLSIAGALLSPSKGIFTFASKILRSYQKRKWQTFVWKNRLHFPVCKPCSIFKCERTVTLHCKAKKESKQESGKRADHLLAAFGLGERKNHYPNQLSGGENKG